MEPTSSTNINVPPDRDRENLTLIEASSSSATVAAANMTATAVSLPSANNQLVLYTERPQSSYSSISSVLSSTSVPSNAASTSSVSAPIEKLSRPMAFDKVRHFERKGKKKRRQKKSFLFCFVIHWFPFDVHKHAICGCEVRSRAWAVL